MTIPDNTSAIAVPPDQATPPGVDADQLTIFHISQWKAASQWVKSVLRLAQPDRLVECGGEMAYGVFKEPLRRGAIYSPLYVNREGFEQSSAAAVPHRKFIVIRDLRDILVSWHKSLLKSHGLNPIVAMHRAKLEHMTTEEGMTYLLRHDHFRGLASVALSWVRSSEPVFRYEDLVADHGSFIRRIFDHCEVRLPEERVAQLIRNRSFQAMTGRAQGQESTDAHYRRGVSGDWRNHFTPELTKTFKELYGHFLVVTGYEENSRW